jgi:predicted PurR-regulated permease PerM
MGRTWQVTLFWLGVLAAILLVLYVVRGILLPFAAGMALAYAFDPVAAWLERRGLGRTGAAVVILATAAVLIVLLALLVVPVLLRQLFDLVERLPTLIDELQGLLVSVMDTPFGRYFGIEPGPIDLSLTRFFSGGGNWLATLAPSLLSGGLALINIVSLFLVTPLVAFYLLRDWDTVIARVDALVPRRYVEDVRLLAREMDDKVAAFVRGQMLLGLILGIFYSVGLVAVGVNYGLLIGLASGILSFIPFAGFITGFTISLVVALAQFWPEWPPIAAVVAIFAAGQMLEAYVLQPRLVGSFVGLHPVWLLFGLFSFGLLFGFVGLLIAVPTTAAVGVLLSHLLDRYRGSSLFRGDDGLTQ